MCLLFQKNPSDGPTPKTPNSVARTFLLLFYQTINVYFLMIIKCLFFIELESSYWVVGYVDSISS